MAGSRMDIGFLVPGARAHAASRRWAPCSGTPCQFQARTPHTLIPFSGTHRLHYVIDLLLDDSDAFSVVSLIRRSFWFDFTDTLIRETNPKFEMYRK